MFTWWLSYECTGCVVLQIFRTEMSNYTRRVSSSFHRLLPIFSWARQQQGSTRSSLQVEVMPPQRAFSTSTELILYKDESPQEMSYTSLRDLMSTNRHVCINVRPNREGAHEEKEEDERPAIKNRLVELAARAYLLPSHAQETRRNKFFSRQWSRFTSRNWLHNQSNMNLSTNVPCLPSPLWVDISRAFCSLFSLSHMRPQPVIRL
ncbi:hypothetical protein M758_2G173400 [Ceratodon purpureus]|nr:hypothetical protein M758_2G173400 [Ceratodon purpureus]